MEAPDTPAVPDGPELSCSFCGKSRHVVKKLIAGPGVYICDECVDLCNQILAEELPVPGIRAKVGDAPGQPEAPRLELRPVQGLETPEVLAELRRTAGIVEPVERHVQQTVQILRGRGVTWAQIGEALGMTRQGAWARFSGEE